MRAKFLWAIGALLLVLAMGATGLFLFREPLLRKLAERSIHESTGLRAEIGELQSNLGSGPFTLHDLKLYNVAAFGGSLLATIPELSIDLDRTQATEGVFHLRNLTLNLEELHVVKDAAGRLNLDGVEKAVRAQVERRMKNRQTKHEIQFGGIDRLQLTLRHVRYTDLNRSNRVHSFDLGLQNEVVTSLKTETELQAWVGTMLFRILMQQSFGSPTPKTTEPGTP